MPLMPLYRQKNAVNATIVLVQRCQRLFFPIQRCQRLFFPLNAVNALILPDKRRQCRYFSG